VAQSDIKRLLSFTLVSHIGYMLFGVGLASTAGLAAAIFYVVHHIVIQTTLFLTAGLIERRGGTTSLEHLGGLARLAPLLGVLFFVPALNLAGIPPFSGFLGKFGLLQAGVDDGGVLAWLLVGGGVLTSLLTLYAISRVWALAFWRTPHPDMTGVDPAGTGPDRAAGTGLPPLMVAATIALVVLGVGLTVVAGPLFDIAADAAAQLQDRQPYVRAVFPDGAP
jgi:multicomponent Na+:H+ antiporter subunit D